MRALHAGEVAAADLVDAALARAEDDRWGSFLAVDAEGARARAREIDALPERPPLGGVPIAIKDALSTRDIPTTAGSRILEGFRPLYTATCVDRLERAGAVVIGKTNMDEFAMGSSTENSAYQVTRNPWDLERVPGRLERRLGRGGRGVPGAVVARQRHRRLHPPAGGALRHRGHEADLRRGLALRADRVRVVARPGGAVRPHGPRRGAAALAHRRPRPDGLDLAGLARADRRPRGDRPAAACASASWTS